MKNFSVNANLKNNKLLIVEDSDEQWLIIQHAIQQYFSKITVQRAATTDQALALLTEWHYQEWEMPKLILLDLYLPRNTDGWQLLRQIKEMADAIRRTPIIMLTASASALSLIHI